MDHIDRKILEILQDDGRISIIQLSKKLHLSRPSTNERLHRLHDKGVIQGFTARVSPEMVGKGMLVFIQIGNLKMECRKFEEVVQEEADVLECHRVTGLNSYVMKVAVASRKDLEAFVDRLILYGQVNTSVVLSSPIPYSTILPKNEN
jgi:Lrp/AsnC family transcriptional regulator, leucine-responsive regulatory protein